MLTSRYGWSTTEICSQVYGVSERIFTLVSVMLSGMAKRNGAMHVAKVSKKYVTKDGASRESVAYLLRRTYRDGGRVKHETLANLSALPQATWKRCGSR